MRGCRGALRAPQADRPPVRRPGPADGARGPGLRRPGSRPRARRLGAAARARPRRPDPDRLGQRAPARALPAAVQPPRRLRHGAARPRRAPRPPAAVRVLGPRGVAAAGHDPAAAALADGARRRRRVGRHAPHPAGAPGAGRRGARGGPRERARRGQRGARARAPGEDGAVVGLVGRQARVRVAVLERADHLRAAARLRAPLRPARARAAARGDRRPPRPRSRTPSASSCGSPPARWAWRPRRTCATTSGCRSRRRGRASPSSWRPASCGRSRWRAGRVPALRAPRGAAAARRARPGAGRPVRLARVGAPAGGAAVRVPLPDRDLRPEAQARPRLLRAAVPARRPARRAGRPQGRPGRGGAARAGLARGARTRRRRRRRSSPPSSTRWRSGSGSAAWRCGRGAISPPRWPPPPELPLVPVAAALGDVDGQHAAVAAVGLLLVLDRQVQDLPVA